MSNKVIDNINRMMRTGPVVYGWATITAIVVTPFAQVPIDINDVGFNVVGVMFTSKRSNGS